MSRMPTEDWEAYVNAGQSKLSKEESAQYVGIGKRLTNIIVHGTVFTHLHACMHVCIVRKGGMTWGKGRVRAARGERHVAHECMHLIWIHTHMPWSCVHTCIDTLK